MKFGENKGLNFNATEGTEGSDTETESEDTEGSEGSEGPEVRDHNASQPSPSEFITPSVVGKVSDVNKELGVVFAVLALVGAVGSWLW